MRFSSSSSVGVREVDSLSQRLRRGIAATAAMLLLAGSFVTMGAGSAFAVDFSGAPTATSSTAVVNVKVGGIRSAIGPGKIDPLEGVRLGLFTSSTSTTPVQTCTSTAGGYCSFSVSGNALNSTYTIKQLDSAPGSTAASQYFANTSLTTGVNTGSFESTKYEFVTPKLSKGKTYTSGVDFMTGSSRTLSGGIWQNSLNNPAVDADCGLNTAIVLDLSTSVANGGFVQDLRDAAKSLITALAGTPSKVALYSFGTRGAAVQASLDTASAANVATLKSKVDGLSVVGSQYTNWDDAFFQLADKKFDQVLVLTDGNPTAYNRADGKANTQLDTRFIESELAIASANMIKAKGTRIIAVGVGDGVSGPGDNLRAISGPVKNSDYYQTADYASATAALKAVALAGCTGTVTVVKNVVPSTSPAGSIVDATPASGWTFSHSTDAGGTATPTPATGVTRANGSINYAIAFAEGKTTAKITITETQQAGYSIVPQNSFNAVCTNNDTGANVPVVNTANGTPGFTVVANKLDAISCAVYNRAPVPGSSIVVDKKWVIDGGSPLADGAQPAGLSGQLTLNGAKQAWGSAKTGLAQGDVIVIDETTTDTHPMCSITSSSITSPSAQNLGYSATLAAGVNAFTITNNVTCSASLTLVKNVVNDDGGTAKASAWTLKATPTTGAALSVPSGTTSTVTAGVTYVLSESAGPHGYRLSGIQCSIDGGAATAATSITLTGQQNATCTFTNDDIAPELKLTKKVSPAGATSAANWLLTGKGTGSASLSGKGGTDYTKIKAGVAYTLAEAPVSGFGGASEFTAGAWVCTPAGGSPTTLVGGALPALALGDKVECVITNTLSAVTPTIVKTAGTPVANTDGTWNISYTVTVSNPSAVSPITYNLTDTLAFGAGITSVPVSVTGPSAITGWTGIAPNNALASAATLAPGASAVYVVTVKATVPKGTPTSAQQCSPNADPAAGGFLNRAVLTVDGTSYPAFDCVEPVRPTFSKTAGAATSQADGKWSVSYTLTVTNPSASTAARYDLVDTLALPAGVVAESVVLTKPANVVATENLPSQPLLVSGASLPAGATHSFVVTVTFAIPSTVDATTLDCAAGKPNKGLFNSAVLTSGQQELTDSACASVSLAAISHTKKVVSTQQNADGTWTIVYGITVTNGSTTAAGVYSLSDVPALGAGITLDSATATGPTTQAAAWNGSTATALAADQAIAAGAVQAFTITVNATVAADVIGTAAADCTLDKGETGTGFLNRATMQSAGASTVATACASPAAPTFTKTIDGDIVASGVDDHYTVSYLLTATNASAMDLYYDLEDTLGFASGVVITSAGVRGPDGPVVGWDGAGSSRLATARVLPAGATEVWTVVVDFAVTERVMADTMQCTTPGTAGNGLFNSAVLTSGSDDYTDSACTGIPPQLPTLPFDPPTLPVTGAQVTGGLLAGLALLGAGLLLLPMRRRSVARHRA